MNSPPDSHHMSVLLWRFSTNAALVRVSGSPALPPESWLTVPLVTSSGLPASAGPLLRLVDEGHAGESAGGELEVDPEALAGLSAVDSQSVGLPPRIDWPLVVSLEGLPTDAQSRASWRFQGRNGRPLLPSNLRGCVVRVEGEDRTLPLPVYRTIRAIEAFNASVGEELEVRVRHWSRVAELLTEETLADDFLRDFRVVSADAFSLQPFLNEAGEVDFDPVPGVRVPDPGGDPALAGFEDRLPQAVTGRFRRYFRGIGSRGRYALDGGWYLVLSPEVRQVLEEVREVQRSTPADRLAFLRNPVGTLEARRPDLDPGMIAGVFAAEDFSERVQGTAVWKPPVLPWVRKEAEKWLPEERLGIRIGEEYVAVRPEDLPDLVREIETAIAQGRPAVEYQGVRIPATDETLRALQHLTGITRPEGGGDEGPDPGNPLVRLVLEVVENFHDVAFTRTEASRTGVDPRSDLSSLRLRNQPHEHQEAAIRWLQSHWLEGSPGALLADDMGLGKTFQTLAFMAWLRSEMEAGRVPRRPMLVVAPTGLLENWVAEQTSHLGDDGLGELVRCYGRDLRGLRSGPGNELAIGMGTLDLQRLRDADWVLTTYETLRDYQHSLGRVHFAFAALDEVQKAKNPASGSSQAAKTIHADLILCLTGTPVENRLADLWNILDIARPGNLGTLREFSQRFESAAHPDSTQLEALKVHLTDKVPVVMLRRMKEDKLPGLPDKNEHAELVPMPEPQAWAYDQVLQRARYAAESGEEASMLAVLGQLRSVSLHPFAHQGEPDEEYVAASARLTHALQVLDRVHGAGEKALIFLESLEMQGTLAGLLQRRYRMTQRPMMINGRVTGQQRQQRVNTFQERPGFDVLILSPRAGGVGLTLTAANHVIHLTRWWNPAVEDQCTDRVYRIGQGRPVHVYYPMAEHPRLGQGSFDAILHQLLDRKRKLSRQVLAPTAFGSGDIEELFRKAMAGGTGALPFGPDDLNEVDLLSPTEFERWVLDRFRRVGYRVDVTPLSHDAGVDGVAHPPTGSRLRPVLVQCKHTQVAATCPDAAVIEIVEGSRRYPQVANPRLLVVTNAARFTARAEELARNHGVELFARGGLGVLRDAVEGRMS